MASSMKMKRKDLEEVVDDFTDFYLTSPARKIRRLDAELPPIMEEDEPGIPIGSRRSVQEEQQWSAPLMEDAIRVTPVTPVNEERALVLYKPVNSIPAEPSTSSSNYVITLNSDFIPGLKEHAFWSGDMNFPGTVDITEHNEEENTHARNNLAIIPWTGHQFPTSSTMEATPSETTEPMEADEMMVDGTMDIEVDDRVQTPGFGEGEGLQKWQQPHCMMTRQLPQNTSTPIMWSW
ncbi:hypothetical protein Sjap_023069 [Stephania japonica]|uniref:Uncharacterized protein n=1 Tax=Stephania japonica TaxID=461633 RepID=A0AAP0HU68_9MAGN